MYNTNELSNSYRNIATRFRLVLFLVITMLQLITTKSYQVRCILIKVFPIYIKLITFLWKYYEHYLALRFSI